MAEDGKKHYKIEHISEKVNEGWEKTIAYINLSYLSKNE